MSVIHSPEVKSVSWRDLIIPIFLAIFFIIFVAQLWLLQIVRSEELKERAKMTGLLMDHTLAPRGKIYDRSMTLLADVRPKIVITAKPGEALAQPEMLERLAKLLGTSRKKLEWTLNQYKPTLPVALYVGATVDQGTRIAEAPDEFPGIGVETLPMRAYPDPKIASHMLGFVWVPTDKIEQELKESGADYIPPYIGRDGLERSYESVLGGLPGTTTFTADARGRPMRLVISEAPTPGDSLILGLDAKVQKLALELLKGHKGAVVALDPKTGDVICMASSPGYRADVYEGGLSQAEADALYKNRDVPLLKRPIAGRYAPGSTWKIVTAMAAYQAGKFTTGDSVSCPGYLMVGRRRVRCENHPPGSFNFRNAFTRSCNSYFGRLAQRVGADQMEETAKLLGFGSGTGLDIPGESVGLVPDAAFVKKTHGRPWSLGDTNNIGIGQGDLLVTPLQMALLACLVANEGVSYKPHAVRGFVGPGEGAEVRLKEREVLHQFDADSTFWSSLKSAMQNVVAEGTARSAQIAEISVGGKTGSAENPAGRLTHAWFVGYAPVENPKIAFAVILENAGHGGAVAAPIAKQVVEAYLRRDVSKSTAKDLDISVTVSTDSPSDSRTPGDSRIRR